MKNENKILKINLNGNQLKIIAVICMILDHLGYFFVSKIPYELYFALRCIGRIAMPIFLFLLVEGFYHTKDLKKYIIRILQLAIITQVIIIFFNYINTNYCACKIKNLEQYNILFSFAMILVVLRLIDRNILKKVTKKNYILDIVLRCIIIFLIISVYFFVKIDYGICLSLMAIIIYYSKKLENKIDTFWLFFLQIVLMTIFSVIAVKNTIGVFASVSYLFISLYNGKKGKKSKMISYMYYIIFPLQYLIIYLLAIICI